MPFRDLRQFANHLESIGELKRITRDVDRKYEISAHMRKTCDIQGPALLFEKVKGSTVPVLGGLFATRSKALEALEADNATAVAKFLRGLRDPVPPKSVSKGPCKDVILHGDEIDITKFPHPIYSEEDGGPYITLGIQISKDPEDGVKNAGIYRMQIKGKNRLGIMAQKFQQISTHLARAEAQNKPLEVAVALGVEPVSLLTGGAKIPYGVDEFGVAGGIRGEPIEMVKCETVDLEVPAHSEIVIEGKLLPHVREVEGPFGEFTGYYGPAGKEPVMEITAITHRESPLYLAGLTGVPVTDNHIMKEIPWESAVYEELRKQFPEITAVHYPPSGGTQLVLFIAVRQRYAGEARNIIMAAVGSPARPKLVVVVDDDIDIYDLNQVMWAITFRSQPDEDVIIISNMSGGPLDPSTKEQEVTSIMGIDATKPYGKPFPHVVKVPGVEKIPDRF